MSVLVNYADMGISLDDALHLKCNCGHELGEHGFITDFINPTDALIVSQCCLCPIKDSEFTCSHFELK